MHSCQDWLSALQKGRYDEQLQSLYPLSPECSRSRVMSVVSSLQQAFSPAPETPAVLFSAPGRTELGGNHTDHQGGHVLCSSIELDLLACAVPNGTHTIRILPEGQPLLTVTPDELASSPEEHGTSLALVRGMAACIAQWGYPLSGFDAYLTSAVPMGSGLSSSAAFEVLLGNVLSYFCCNNRLDPLTIAKAGQ